MSARLAWILAPLLLAVFAGSAHAISYNFEVRELTGANLFSRNVYFCPFCTLEQFEAVTPPAGFEKAPPRQFLPSSATATLPAPPAGVAPSLDLVPDLPGDDFVFVAEVLSGTVVGFDPALGVMAVAQVQRQNVFTYDAGTLVHEVTDDVGNLYILFSLNVEEGIDPTAPDALASLGLPAGWSYASRVLADDLVIDSGGLANVFVQGLAATYQRYVPEPGSAVLLGVGLAALARRRRNRV